MKTTRKQSCLSSRLRIAVALLIVVATIAASSANYALNWFQIGAGGGEGVHSTSYRFSSLTVGQGATGNTASQSYAFAAGYQQDFTPPQPTNTPGGPTNTPRPTFTPIATYTPASTGTPRSTSTPIVPTVTPTDCPNPFVDVTGNIFYVAIHYLNCRGVVNGTDTSHYSPAGTSTRGQFAKVVVLGFGLQFYTPFGGQHDFTDVPTSYFAYLYIETGFHYGVLSGFDTASCIAAGITPPCYLPNRPITRGQLTKLVVNAAHYPLYTPTSGPTFTDVPTSNVFYVSIETAAHKGVVNGYPDHTFHPNNNIRRDEMAQIVYKGVITP